MLYENIRVLMENLRAEAKNLVQEAIQRQRLADTKVGFAHQLDMLLLKEDKKKDNKPGE